MLILDTHVPIPRPDDIKASLSGCQYFSKLDFKSAFHQLQISPASRYITVFHGDDRLMRYKRLTMGTKPASGELSKALTPLFSDIPSAHVIHDDVIIGTKTKEDHDLVLEKVLNKIELSGLTLNPDKCKFGCKGSPILGNESYKPRAHARS